MSNPLLPLLIVVQVDISQILGIITLVPVWFIVRRTVANVSSYNASLLLVTISNLLGKSLPSWFTLCRYVGTHCGMLYSRTFGVTTQVLPKTKTLKVHCGNSFLCLHRTGTTDGRSPDISSV